jgi:hypothetical protein
VPLSRRPIPAGAKEPVHPLAEILERIRTETGDEILHPFQERFFLHYSGFAGGTLLSPLPGTGLVHGFDEASCPIVGFLIPLPGTWGSRQAGKGFPRRRRERHLGEIGLALAFAVFIIGFRIIAWGRAVKAIGRRDGSNLIFIQHTESGEDAATVTQAH